MPISEIPKKCREKVRRHIPAKVLHARVASLLHLARILSSRSPSRECCVSAIMSSLTAAPLAARVSSLSGLAPRRGVLRNVAPSGRGFPRNDRVDIPSSRRTATVTPRASAKSAPEFAPGGKNAHLTALPPLRSWARARARAVQHVRPPRDEDEDISETGAFGRAPFFRLVRDYDDDETARTRDDRKPLRHDADAEYNFTETLVEETAGFVRLAKSAFLRFFEDRPYRRTFGAPLAGFPGVDAERERASAGLRAVLRRTRGGRLGVRRGTLLDLGCGSGALTERFAAEGQYDAVVAVDDSGRACEAAARRTSDDSRRREASTARRFERNRSSVAVVLASSEDLPFQDSVFDAAHANAGAHAWPRPSRVVREAARVLKPGGVLVAAVAVLDDAARREAAARGVDAAAYAETRKRCFSAHGARPMPYWDVETACSVFAEAFDLERCELETVDQTYAIVTCSKKSRRAAATAGRVIKPAGEDVSARVAAAEKRNNAVRHTSRALESEDVGGRVVKGVYDASAAHGE